MIDESLLKSAQIGRDGFTWWIGRVAKHTAWKDSNKFKELDPKGGQGHRCKVRIIGYHPFDSDTLPEDDLPWAHIMMSPSDGSGQGGMGITQTLRGGETCMGFFLDGDEAQQPVVMGVINRHLDIKNAPEMKNAFATFSGYKPTGKNPTKVSAESGVVSGKGNNSNAQIDAVDDDKDDDTTETTTTKVTISPANKKLFDNLGDSERRKILLGEDGETVEGVKITTDLLQQLNQYQLDKGEEKNKKEKNIKNRGKGGGESTSTFNGGLSQAAANAEGKFTQTWIPPSSCGEGGIGQISQAVTDFMTVLNAAEGAAGKFINPLRNKLINIQNEIKGISQRVGSIMKGIINNIRDGLLSKILGLFKIFSGLNKITNPLDQLTGSAFWKAAKTILKLLFCIFDKVVKKIIDSLVNMFRGLVNSIVNGPLCSVKQFVAGILGKAMGFIENLTGPLISGISWLTGGLASITGVLGNASSMVRKIFNFLACAGLECDTPSKWASGVGASIDNAADDWQEELDQVEIFKGIQKQLGNVEDYVDQNRLAKAIAGGDLNTLSDIKVGGSSLPEIMKKTNELLGGNASSLPNYGLGTYESALATMTLFGNGGGAFDACNQKSYNPVNQDDIIPMPIGHTYDKCIPPEAKLSGPGSGAELEVLISPDSRIFSVEVLSGGSGYDYNSDIGIIDNTNHGAGADAELVIEDGSIVRVDLVSSGFGYCASIRTPVGIVTAIDPIRPGIGYTDGDRVVISNPITGIGITRVPITITPYNGSIINVPINLNYQFTQRPLLTVDTKTGYGAQFSVVMKDINTSAVDDVVRPLVGITSVIDCPPDERIGTV